MPLSQFQKANGHFHPHIPPGHFEVDMSPTIWSATKFLSVLNDTTAQPVNPARNRRGPSDSLHLFHSSTAFPFHCLHISWWPPLFCILPCLSLEPHSSPAWDTEMASHLISKLEAFPTAFHPIYHQRYNSKSLIWFTRHVTTVISLELDRVELWEHFLWGSIYYIMFPFLMDKYYFCDHQ